MVTNTKDDTLNYSIYLLHWISTFIKCTKKPCVIVQIAFFSIYYALVV